MSARLFSLRNAPSPSEADGERPPTFQRGLEAAALLLFALATFLILALATTLYDPFDPRVTGADWMGPAGAAIGRFLVQGFGLGAWLLPIELVLLGVPLLFRRLPKDLGFRAAGDLVVAILFAALLRVAFPEATAFGHAPVGGNVGLLFGELMRGLFSTPGSFLVGTTIIGLILIGRSSFSFIALCHRLVHLSQLVWGKTLAVAQRLREAWRMAASARQRRREALSDVELRATLLAGAPAGGTLASLQGWMPLERTGAPPLALTEALRKGVRAPYSLWSGHASPGDEPTPTPSGVSETPSRDATPESRSAVAHEEPEDDEALPDDACEGEELEELSEPHATRALDGGSANTQKTATKKTRVAEGPTIVDTSPERRIKRSSSGGKPEPIKNPGFVLPSPDLLAQPVETQSEIDRDKVLALSRKLVSTLSDYGVVARVEEIHPGPTVTTYEVSPEAGTKVSKVANLSDDLALGLSRKVRIIAPIPGKNRIGFELPNDERVPVSLRELIEDKRFEALAQRAPLPVVLGRDIVGAPSYADLSAMPHVILAGATGAGKSVGLNVMLTSLLFCRTPQELRLLMIDPKVVELAPFDGIPHMLLPVVTDMKQAATALKWAVNEMERRYQLFAQAGTKNITTYNRFVERVLAGEIPAPQVTDVTAVGADGEVVSVPTAKSGGDGALLPARLPYIVVVVDEFADLMMQQGKDVEVCVARLAQKARAAGMHVVLATQRPSVDVITGMIKANFPSRVAYRVAQKVDSRTILDEQGAEVLLGKGDMLVKLNGASETRRVQCPFVSEEEVSAVTDHLRAQGAPEYHEAILKEDDEAANDDDEDADLDARFDEAVRIVGETQRCSTSWLQRKMTIGYNRAAKIVEQMEKRGMVGPPNGAKDREVLIPPL